MSVMPKLVERNLTATYICKNELNNIAERYGSISGRGINWLPYHNATHTEQVHDAAYAIATQLVKGGVLDALDLPLVRIAAAFHDHEHDLGLGHNEEASAAAAARELTKYSSLYSEEDIQKVRDMIEGTEVSFDADGTMHQAAARDDILQAIVADADLSSLGSPSYALMAIHLLLEIQATSGRIMLPDSVEDMPAIYLDRGDVVEFLQNQHRLIANHTFYLDASTALFASEQARNVIIEKSLLADHEAGGSFAELYRKSANLSTACKPPWEQLSWSEIAL